MPILYRHRFMALIKETLNRSDADYKQLLYPAGDSGRSKQVKPFAFSIVIPPNKIPKREKIVIDDTFYIMAKGIL
ncbi:MAG: hypothetical protein E3K32_14010 [wastewater metagenome]|nr:hypothetical protein [Candidatus Loosdrechtia aerotolerans]